MPPPEDLDHHPTLTGYRFLCMATGVGYLLAKSILTYLYKPESLINIADIVYGVSSIGLLFWLGLYEHRPRLLPQLIYRFLFKESIWSYVTLSLPNRRSAFIELMTGSTNSLSNNILRESTASCDIPSEQTSNSPRLSCDLEMSSSRPPLGTDRALPKSMNPTYPVMNTESLLHSPKDIPKELTEIDELSDRFTAMVIPLGTTPTAYPIVPPPDRRYGIPRPSIFSEYPMLRGDLPNSCQLFPQVPPLVAPYPALFNSDYRQSYPPSEGNHSQSSLHSDGDYWQYSLPSHYDDHGPSLSSPPADYSTATFIASPYETVRPPGEATLVTRSVHEAARRRRKRPARFRCELCPTDFTAKHNLENHMNSHRNNRPHKCKLGCGKSFGTAQVLRRHEPKCKATASL